MAHILNAVKHHLRNSYNTNSTEAVHTAYKMLQAMDDAITSGVASDLSVSNELYILCAEAAIHVNEWDLAEKCLEKFAGQHAPTKSLEARSLYCDSLVALHNISPSLRGKAKVTAHLKSVTKIVTGIKTVLEDWPKDIHTLIVGIDYAWHAIQGIYGSVVVNSVLEVVVLIITLIEKLSLGEQHWQLQWFMRYAMCLRGAGRVQEALNQTSIVSDMALKMGAERLHLQLFRVQVTLSSQLHGSRVKQEYVQPVFQALHALQSFFCGYTDGTAVQAELMQVYEKLLNDPEKKEVKVKGRKAAESDAHFRDTSLIMDILREIVLVLAQCGADEFCASTLQRLVKGDGVRSRLLVEYTQVILRARACGLFGAAKALDASFLTRSMADTLFTCIKITERTMDNARMIDDLSERTYMLETGCVLLWNLSLPLLQPETRGRLRHTLKRIVAVLLQSNSHLNRLAIRAAYESGLVEFEEDNLHAAVDIIDKALTIDYYIINADGGVTYPMDFVLNWLKRRVLVRKQNDGSSLASEEDQIIHFIEQARMAATALNRVLLLQSAAERLPPLMQVVQREPEPRDRVVSSRSDRVKGAKARRQTLAVEAAEELRPSVVTNITVAHIYYLLFKEAIEVRGPVAFSLVIKMAESLTGMHINEDSPCELLVMKAEAHLSIANVLHQQETTNTTDTTHDSSGAMSHIVKAAQLGVKLCSVGYHGAWIVVNACLLLVNQQSRNFRRGLFLPASAALGDLCIALNQTNADPMEEYKIFDDIGFGYVMSLIQSYILVKGEVNGELHCESLIEAIQKVCAYPTCEANNAILKQASDACYQMMSKWPLPSRRKNFCLILPCINRLLERGQEISTHPQEQLLFLLGRLSKPMPVSDKRRMVNVECLDLLRADPSVELCARLAAHSVQIPENERVTLELCHIAGQLYKDGKLGWGTKSYINMTAGKEKHWASVHSATVSGGSAPGQGGGASNSPSSGLVGSYPKPVETDWYWYADILFNEATMLMRLENVVERSKRFDLQMRALVALTNSAVAASRSLPAYQMMQLSNAYHTFSSVANTVTGPSRDVLFSGLQILLSPLMLSKLHSFFREKSDDEWAADGDSLCTTLTSLAGCLFTSLLERGAYKEGIKKMKELLDTLPLKYHKGLYSFEAQFRCKVGLSTKDIQNKLKGVDAEVEAAVFIAVAMNTNDRVESMSAWKHTLEVLEDRPILRADALLQMAEWFASRGEVSRGALTSMLLSALSSLERGTAGQRFPLQGGSFQADTGGLLGFRQAMSTAVFGRAFTANHTASTQCNLGGPGQVDLPSLREVLMAMRIVYFIFILSPETPTRKEPFLSKRSCASVLLYYVFAGWQVVAMHTHTHKWDSISGSRLPPLELPEMLHDWQGFHADAKYADLIRSISPDDLSLNTGRLWGMLLDVCDFLLEENMELYVFVILSWVEFSVYWRHGHSSPYAEAAVRAVELKALEAAARCGWGDRISMYMIQPPDALYWSKVKELLFSADYPSTSLCLPSSGWINFDIFVGSMHRFVLIEAEELFVLGRVQEALQWVSKVRHCAKSIGDGSALLRCTLLEVRALILRGECERALEELEAFQDIKDVPLGEEDECSVKAGNFFGAHSMKLWVEVQLVRFKGLIGCERMEVAISLAENVQRILLEYAGDENCSETIKETAWRSCKIMAQGCAQRLSALLNLPEYRFAWPRDSEEIVRDYLHGVCSLLQDFGDWKSRLIALRVRQKMRPYVDEVFLDKREYIDRELPEMLHSEYCEALEVTELLRREMDVLIPPSVLKLDSSIHPTVAMAYNEIHLIRGRNCMERDLLKRFILSRYHQLTIMDLGIPLGEHPELEHHVVKYMRDPGAYELVKEAEMDLSSGGSHKKGLLKRIFNEKEAQCALRHFKIPQCCMRDTTGACFEAMLYRAMDHPDRLSMVQLEACVTAAVAEFERRLNAFSELNGANQSLVSATDMDSLRMRENSVLTEKWSSLPALVRQVTPNRKLTTTELRRRRRSSCFTGAIPLKTPESLWKQNGSNLEGLLLKGISQSVRLFEYKQAARCYMYLAHNFILSEMLCAAGTAVEFAQAATMCDFVLDLHHVLLKSSPEGTLMKLVERMKTDTPHLLGTLAYETLRSRLVDCSSMWKHFDFVGDWPLESNKAAPLPPDTCTFTVVREGNTSYFLVVLRRPEGDVCCRRVELDVPALLESSNKLEALRQLKKEEIGIRGIPKEGKTDMKLTLLLKSIMGRIGSIVYPLWEGFMDIFSWLAPTSNLYLCLDPLLHSLPLEQLPELSSFLSVQRELSVVSLRHKFSLRVGKQPPAGTLFLVDPFGEGEGPAQAAPGVEARTRGSNNDVITFGKDKDGCVSRPSMSYIIRGLSSSNYNSLLVEAYGSFSDIVKPSALADLRLDHIQAGIILESINGTSLRRDQKSRACKSTTELLYERHYVLSILLLARGMQYVVTNNFFQTPEECSALSKRCTAALSGGGKAILEAIKCVDALSGSSGFSSVMIYGLPPSGKQK